MSEIKGLRVAYEAILSEVEPARVKAERLFNELKALKEEWGQKTFQGVRRLREIDLYSRFNTGNALKPINEKSFTTVYGGTLCIEDVLRHLSYWTSEATSYEDKLKKANEIIEPQRQKTKRSASSK